MFSPRSATFFHLAIGAFLSTSAQAGAATIEAKSASFDDVSAAVTAAKDGDTVHVPPGTTTWICLERSDVGSIYIYDHDVTAMAMHVRARYGVSYLAQEASIFRKLTVADNIMAILELTDLPASFRKNRCEQLMEEFRVAHLRKSFGYMLSGGERRRVEIARALAMEPKFILLDEPFTGIDPIAIADIQDIINVLRAKGMGILITDHSVRETLAITDRAYYACR
jgi:LPS export ABC transporter ATP-binding protein